MKRKEVATAEAEEVKVEKKTKGVAAESKKLPKATQPTKAKDKKEPKKRSKAERPRVELNPDWKGLPKGQKLSNKEKKRIKKEFKAQLNAHYKQQSADLRADKLKVKQIARSISEYGQKKQFSEASHELARAVKLNLPMNVRLWTNFINACIRCGEVRNEELSPKRGECVWPN